MLPVGSWCPIGMLSEERRIIALLSDDFFAFVDAIGPNKATA
jgi:hypothetical protein